MALILTMAYFWPLTALAKLRLMPAPELQTIFGGETRMILSIWGNGGAQTFTGIILNGSCYMGNTDEHQMWVEQSRNGDHAAFAALIRAYQPSCSALSGRKMKIEAKHLGLIIM